jgi:ribosome-interacting GTPase 1
MMHFEDVQIQLVDTPSLNPDFVEPALMDLIRRSDLILALVDLQAFPIQQIEDTIALLEENRIVPRRWKDRYSDARRIAFVPLQVVVNKNDDERSDGDFEVLCELLADSAHSEEDWSLLAISATTGRNLERLRALVFERLEIMRIYSKPPGHEPDLSAPFVMHQEGTLEEFAGAVHQDFVRRLKSARVWGTNVYEGQTVGRDHVLHDGDIVELRI